MNLQLTILYIFSFLADVLRYKSIFLLPSWWLFFLSSSVCQYHFVFIHQSCVKSLNSFVFNLNLHLKRKEKMLLEVLYGLFCVLAFAALTAEGSDMSVL